VPDPESGVKSAAGAERHLRVSISAELHHCGTSTRRIEMETGIRLLDPVVSRRNGTQPCRGVPPAHNRWKQKVHAILKMKVGYGQPDQVV
jgi:hypothetical protein